LLTEEYNMTENTDHAFVSVFEHLTNAYDVATDVGNAAAMHFHAAAIEELQDTLATLRVEIEAAIMELDTVTAWDVEQSDALGCAENALDRALGLLP